MSIGGATYTEGGFSSDEEAVTYAEKIWAQFGPDFGDGSVERPFDDASVDGFDLDFEAPVAHMVAFANHLRELMDAADGDHYLTAAPQCPFPDASNDEMLDGAVEFDIVWVQFYNNFCGLPAFSGGNPGAYNFETWDNWAKNASKNPDVKIMTGAPASPSAAGSGYVEASALAEIIEYNKQFTSFGGVMLWDVSQAYANPGFLDTIKAALGGGLKRVMRRGLRLSEY